MAEQELNLLIKLKDEASTQLKQMNAALQDNAKQWTDNYGAIQSGLQASGAAMVAFGALITGSLAYSVSKFEQERVEIASLTNTLKNVGVEYDNVKSSLDDYIESTMRATGISDNEQRAGLEQLILITGDYKRSLEILPIALDLAKAKNMDVMDAARLLGRVVEGDINALNRYGFSMDGVTTAGQALNVIQDRVKGSAEAMRSPYDVLRNSFEELSETVGALISGPVGKILLKTTEVIDAINKWADENPELAGSILEVAGAIGIASIAVGTFAIAIVGAMTLIKLFGGPIGWLIIAIEVAAVAIVAAGIYIWLHWEEISHNLAKIWNDMKLAFRDVVNFLISAGELWVNNWIGGINTIISGVNLLGGHLEKLKEINLDRVTAEMLGASKMSWWINPNDVDAVTGASKSSGGNSVYPINQFGNYGNLGQTFAGPGGASITINNAGSVISGQDLTEQIRQILIQVQNRNGTTGIR